MNKDFMEEVIENTFSELKSEITRRFFNIKEDIFKSSVYSFDKYNIYGTIINKEDLKIFENHFCPVLKEDTEDINLLEKIIFSEDEILIENIFIKESSDIINYIDNTIIKGSIVTDKGIFSALFRIKKNKKYMEKIYDLYNITKKNKLNWRVLNLPYVNKFMSVYLESYDENILFSSSINEIKYNTEVSYSKELIFCWNIREQEYDYEEYVKPTEEQLTYEYLVNVSYYKKYLLNLDKGDIMISYIADEKNIIFITNQKVNGKLKLWEVLDKTDNDLEEYLTYSVYSNEVKHVKNKELFYYKEDFISLVDNLLDIDNIKLQEIIFDAADKEILETLNYNYFLKEEFEIKNKRQKIYLKFVYEETIFLNEIAGYIISILNLRNKDLEFIALKN